VTVAPRILRRENRRMISSTSASDCATIERLPDCDMERPTNPTPCRTSTSWKVAGDVSQANR
jgi:hypothetical protein